MHTELYDLMVKKIFQDKTAKKKRTVRKRLCQEIAALSKKNSQSTG